MLHILIFWFVRVSVQVFWPFYSEKFVYKMILNREVDAVAKVWELMQFLKLTHSFLFAFFLDRLLGVGLFSRTHDKLSYKFQDNWLHGFTIPVCMYGQYGLCENISKEKNTEKMPLLSEITQNGLFWIIQWNFLIFMFSLSFLPI